MNVVQVPAASLRHAEYNPRKITPEQFAQIEKSIQKFGFLQPLIVNNHPTREGIIVGGNQRFEVLKKLGHTEMPVVYVSIENLDEEKELNIRLNKNQADWDWEVLQKEFQITGLTDWGFEKREISLKFDFDSGNAESQGVPEKPAEAKAKRGEIYMLGKHRLMCGDSTAREDVRNLMGGDKAQLVYSDPPYGILYDGGVGSEREDAYHDDFKDYEEFIFNIYSMAHEFSDDKAAIMIWFASKKMFEILNAIKRCGYELREILIWNKPNAHYGALNCQYKIRYEPCLYGFKKGKSPRWFGDTAQRNLVDVDQPAKNELHPTMKPVELYKIFIPNHTEAGDVVYEPFSGSGTTLIACEQTQRICYGMEIDPAYCDVIIKRWCNLTGVNPEDIYKNAMRPAEVTK